MIHHKKLKIIVIFHGGFYLIHQMENKYALDRTILLNNITIFSQLNKKTFPVEKHMGSSRVHMNV